MKRRISAAVAFVVLVGASLVLAAGPASAGGGGHCNQPLEAAKGTTVLTDGTCFTPSVLHVNSGERVTFREESGIEHMVSGLGHEWGSELPIGTTAAFSFDESGVYPFFCDYHMGMVGAIVVGDGIASGLGTGAVNPVAPETVEDPVDETVDGLTGGDALGAASAGSSGSSGPRAGALAIVAAGLGFGVGLILRRRLRMPSGEPAKVPVP